MGSPTLTLEDALRDVTRLGMDTAAIIYFVEANPTRVDQCRAVFREVLNGRIIAFTSLLTLTETLVHPLRNADRVLEEEYRVLLLETDGIISLSVDAPTAHRAADLRARYGLRTPDAIQLATAIGAGCEAFLTNDGGLRRVKEFRVIVLDDLTL